ncbi:MAG: methanogenesis marker 12 protein [Candidatus Hydrothermarchaeaceae archaeon]
MSTLGIDHGTRAVRFYVEPEGLRFEMGREEILEKSALELIDGRFPLDDIELVCLTYSMGDGIEKITDIRRVKNRGVLRKTTGAFIGGGTKVYDEIRGSKLKAVVIPGLHRGITALDPRFRALYSHCASAEKVSLAYHAHLETGARNLIVSDVGSNTVTIGIKDSKFFGAVDACLGAIGMYHGPMDLQAIRDVDDGKTTANKAFYSSGVTKIYSAASPRDVLEPKNEEAKLALESLILSVEMEIASFSAEISPEAIVITGEFGVHDNVYSVLEDSLSSKAMVHRIDGYSAAMGSAEIARDVLGGKKDFLGLDVDYK